MGRLLWVVAVPLLSWVACSASVPAPPESPVAVAEAPAPAPPLQPTPLGSWSGSYVCTQGLTGLDLVVQPSADGQLAAVFRFYGLPGNPTVPPGRFAMAGRVDPDGTVRLFASEDDWIEQPPNYVVVGLAGRVSADAARFDGLVTDGQGGFFAGCTTFSLLRSGQ